MDEVDEQQPQPAQDNHAAAADTKQARLFREMLGDDMGVLYALACVTKHVKSYWVLMLGRVLGGISTSLLFSSFEAWLICQPSR